MSNPNVAIRKARRIVGRSEEHLRSLEAARLRRLEESPFVGIMNRVQSGDLSIEEGKAAILELQAAGH